MKRVLLILAPLLLAAQLIVAQESSSPVRYGIQGGLNLTRLTGDDDSMVWNATGILSGDLTSERKSSAAFSLGIYVSYALTQNFAIQPELNYTKKGATYEGTLDSGTDEFGFSGKVKLGYLELPLLFKYTLGTPGGTNPYVFAGPAVGVLVLATGTGEISGLGEGDINIEEFVKDTEVSGVFGAGIEFPVKNGEFGVQARYDLGLTNIAKMYGAEVKTGTVSLLLTYSQR